MIEINVKFIALILDLFAMTKDEHVFKILLSAAAFLAVISHALGQDTRRLDDLQAGHKVAVLVCANCHMAASDQSSQPILRPPAPSFASIARRKDLTIDWLRNFIKTTHRTIEHPNNMPNPMLLDDQIEDVCAYILSLRRDR